MTTNHNASTQIASMLKSKGVKPADVPAENNVLVKFRYNGKDRVVRPYEIGSRSIGGWVLSEPGEAPLSANGWAGENNEPFKKFLVSRMENVSVSVDAAAEEG